MAASVGVAALTRRRAIVVIWSGRAAAGVLRPFRRRKGFRPSAFGRGRAGASVAAGASLVVGPARRGCAAAVNPAVKGKLRATLARSTVRPRLGIGGEGRADRVELETSLGPGGRAGGPGAREFGCIGQAGKATSQPRPRVEVEAGAGEVVEEQGRLSGPTKGAADREADDAFSSLQARAYRRAACSAASSRRRSSATASARIARCRQPRRRRSSRSLARATTARSCREVASVVQRGRSLCRRPLTGDGTARGIGAAPLARSARCKRPADLLRCRRRADRCRLPPVRALANTVGAGPQRTRAEPRSRPRHRVPLAARPARTAKAPQPGRRQLV